MQPYPNYYPNNQMPMYSQGYNPMMNAQQRLAQMEQQYPQLAQQNYVPQQQMPVGLNGKIVDDFSTLTANDVPMDNIGAFFIKRDGSEVQHRIWGNMGNIEVTSYLPRKDENNSQVVNSSSEAEKAKFDLSDASTEAFMKRFDDIAERIEKLEKTIVPAKTARAKKEADAE